ncbi:zinc-binding dehydrogenase [bacterium]|nr:zinc-binding dehydrogenase [bacterium]
MKTKAVVFTSPCKFSLEEITLKKMRENEMLVRTLITAISPGTERWILKGKHIGTKFPNIPGYHRIGIVEECGKNVKKFQPGDIVYGFSAEGCWKEKIVSMWGAHLGYSVDTPSQYKFISSEMPSIFELETTCFTILTSVAHRGMRFLEVKGGEKILIIGAGFLGICAAQFALLKNAFPVIIEKNDERVEFGKKFIPYVIKSDRNIEKKLKEIAPEGFDIVYDTAGVPEVIDMCIQHTKRWGKLLLQAQYFDKQHCAIDLDQIKIREITVKTTIGFDEEDWETTFKEIKRRRLNIADLITHRFYCENSLEAYKILLSGKPFNLGIVIYWDKNLWERRREK